MKCKYCGSEVISLINSKNRVCHGCKKKNKTEYKRNWMKGKLKGIICDDNCLNCTLESCILPD